MSKPRSKNMQEKSKFEAKYMQCNTRIQETIKNIINTLDNKYKFHDWGFTDKPDLRFNCSEMVFCMFELNPPNNLSMYIRVDSLEYQTEISDQNLTNRFRASSKQFAGKKWIETKIHQGDNIQDLLFTVHNLCQTRIETGGW